MLMHQQYNENKWVQKLSYYKCIVFGFGMALKRCYVHHIETWLIDSLCVNETFHYPKLSRYPGKFSKNCSPRIGHTSHR